MSWIASPVSAKPAGERVAHLSVKGGDPAGASGQLKACTPDGALFTIERAARAGGE